MLLIIVLHYIIRRISANDINRMIAHKFKISRFIFRNWIFLSPCPRHITVTTVSYHFSDSIPSTIFQNIYRSYYVYFKIVCCILIYVKINCRIGWKKSRQENDPFHPFCWKLIKFILVRYIQRKELCPHLFQFPSKYFISSSRNYLFSSF